MLMVSQRSVFVSHTHGTKPCAPSCPTKNEPAHATVPCGARGKRIAQIFVHIAIGNHVIKLTCLLFTERLAPNSLLW